MNPEVGEPEHTKLADEALPDSIAGLYPSGRCGMAQAPTSLARRRIARRTID